MTPKQEVSVGEEASNAGKLPIVYVGPVYRVKMGEGLESVARRFRTSVKSILAVNPDIEDEQDVVPDQTELCLIPCSQRRMPSGPAATV